MVGFGEAIKRAFAGWSTWAGRSTRAEYWWWFLFVWLISLVPYIGIFASMDWSSSEDGTVKGSGGGVIWWVLFIALWLVFILPSIAVSVRRLHDTDRSGWWMLIGIIPLIGTIVLIVFFCLRGTEGPNRFGEGPMAPVA